MLLNRTIVAAAAILTVFCATTAGRAQDKAAVDWGTPGNAVPCDAWEKNDVAEVWTAVKPVSINGKKAASLVLGKGAMEVGNTNVWQIVDSACSRKG